MQIKIDLKIFAIIIIFIITKNIGIYALLMLFALIHEIGHLVSGLILGFKPKSISIAPYGFKLGFQINCIDYNKKIKNGNMLSIKKIIIAFAGPLTNIISIFILFLFKDYIDCYQKAIYANILLALFNLIPIYPLDGGRIFQECIHIFIGLRSSYIYTKTISNINVIILTVISSILILLYKNIIIFVTIVYLWLIVLQCNKEFNMKEIIYKKIDENM